MSADQHGVALVTGASRGLGLECVRQLAALGFTVLAGVRDVERGRASIRSLKRSESDAIEPGIEVIQLDVTSDADIAACAGLIRLQHGGQLDVLINNAAIIYDTGQTTVSADLALVAKAFDTNVLGCWRAAQMAVAFMKQRRHGRIVNVSSGAGQLGTMSGTPAYSISKLALNGLTLLLAKELRRSGILVNAVCPGWVATDMGGSGGRPVEDGAKGIVWAATLPDDGPTGGFFRDGKAIGW